MLLKLDNLDKQVRPPKFVNRKEIKIDEHCMGRINCDLKGEVQ